MAEVGLTRTGGDDQAVVRELDTFVAGRPDCVHDTAFEIEPVDLEELDGDARDASKHVSQRRRDLARREHPGCDLVQQRLEEVMVSSVDQRGLDALDVAEEARRGQPAESASDDDHVVRHSPSKRARNVEKRVYQLFISLRALRIILSGSESADKMRSVRREFTSQARGRTHARALRCDHHRDRRGWWDTGAHARRVGETHPAARTRQLPPA